MTDCNGACSGCASAEDCAQKSAFEHEKTNEFSKIRFVVGVVSGKGGVGKSLVTSWLASAFARKGLRTAVLDADITGPSIPKIFGVNDKALADEQGILPATSRTGIKMMSVNLLLEDVESPVVWRGPMIAGVVKQFWSEVKWGDVDIMLIDMPPGTGDVPLTVYQSLPLDGIVIVTTPQDLVSMIVKKALGMAQMMHIPVLGLVENMSYALCPDCGTRISVFGESKTAQTALETGLPLLGQIPIDPKLAELCDEGKIEEYEGDALYDAVSSIESKLNHKMP